MSESPQQPAPLRDLGAGKGVRRRWRRYPSWAQALRPLLPGLVETGTLALVCNAAVELSSLSGVEHHPWQFKTPAFVLLFLLDSSVIWLLVGLVHAVVGRLWLTTVLAASVTTFVAFANFEKVRFRREPLYPSDWEFIRDVGFLKDVVGVRAVVLLVLGILLLGVLAFTSARAAGRRLLGPEHAVRQRPSLRTRVAVRLVTGTSCLLCVTYLAGFNAPGNAARGAYDALGADWRLWSQERNYLGNGFVGGFLYNLDVPAMRRPAGYSAAEMARITARYTAVARRINRSRDPHGLDHVNVVMILSESFSDPEALRGVHLPADPIPFTRRLMDTTTSGQMLAQNVGGGTANMEFEALTGMSLSQFPPQLGVPYQRLVPGYATFPSAVGWFKSHGHRAVAVHPFTTEMYRRGDVYPILGFDDFVYDHRMHEQRRIGHDGYISDSSAFDEVLRQLRSSSQPVFLNLVTMQNHMPYGGRYDDPVPVTGPDGEQLSDVGQYVRGLTYSDRALRDLVAGLRRSRERTVVVFYGDHLPGKYPASVFDANGPRVMHQTPFFVWANFPGREVAQPTTSPTHFMDLVFERANAAVPPYYALLQQLRRQVPAMDSGMRFDAGNRPLRGRPSPRAARLLHDYRLVQYDLSVGRRYSATAMFGPAG